MKKVIGGLVAALVVGAALFTSSCSITPEQSKVIAQNAGIYSAVIWVAVDNPTTNQILMVKDLVSVIDAKAGDIQAGKTYTEVVYPEIVKVIDAKVPAQDRPLCKAASLTLLNGLDTLFAMHPEWKNPETLALGIVRAYDQGVITGLSMQESNPIMMQARANAAARAKALGK